MTAAGLFTNSTPTVASHEIVVGVTTGHVGSKNKNVGWFAKTEPVIQPAARDLLENYSGIPAEKIVEHVLAIRDQAWEVNAYPCIGQFRFLDLSMMRLDIYPRILEKLKAGGKLLDLGCCLAQDIRKLVVDGVPAENLYGAEYEAPFVDVGYDLFKDRETLGAHFFQADSLDDDPETQLNRLKASIDVIHLGMVLHVFSREDQLITLSRCVEILKPEPGALIVGQAVGHAEGKASPAHEGVISFKHSDTTFKQLIREVEGATGAKFRVKADLDQGLGVGDGKRRWDLDDKTRRLTFVLERVA
ncbi:hypothetical protein BKA67DRAFT_696761 [Truncatella angustata]|uniref:Methyltransferase domain-containing protein n=1 Tax=Truncatella angustata TaxID=152316 RepID=A0A9P8UBJ4_9PEZI|nr:uncharacterized protein BKA67DRAFT_696761 [Truncatella angustata]KAH6645005.1 hypothetical protein BKA67DRAFT_696761 [Truncatella angustata]